MSTLRWYPPTLIDETALRNVVRGLPRFGDVRYLVGTDSTQSRALEILHRLDALGISFVTESQDMGRGRSGRRWISPPAAGLLFSTILPAELRGASLPAVGFWAALAVADAVKSVCSVTLGYKWPNDLLLDGRKCAGLLSEGRTAGSSTRIVLGVGINVNRPEEVPDPLLDDAAWLSDSGLAAIDRTRLLAAILARYEASFDDLLERPVEVIATWAKHAALDGKRVTVRAVDGSLLQEGVVRGISPDGALLLRNDNGDAAVTLGDVSVL